MTMESLRRLFLLITVVLVPMLLVQTSGSSSSSENRSSEHWTSGENHASLEAPTDDQTGENDAQSRLLRHLFARYDPRKRPVRNYYTATDIKLTMTLYQLVQVNEPEEFLIINVWMAMTWRDEFLAWEPAKFDNISYLVVPWNHLWLSDIVLYNGLDMDYSTSEKRINIELNMEPDKLNSAHVRFAFPAVYRFHCKMNIYYFPFDVQNCTMVFGSWVYDVRFIDVQPHSDNVKMENFITNQEWDVISFTSYRHVLNYTCCPYPYSNVQYHFHIRRKPLFFVCNYVVPTIIVAFISIVGSFMPGTTDGERTEKVTLGISTCLAMSILLLMVSDRLPTAGNYVPIMAWFFIAIIALVAVAICFTTVVIIVQRQGRFGKRISLRWRHIFFHFLARILLVQIPKVFRQKRIRGVCEPKQLVMPLAQPESLLIDDSAPPTFRRDDHIDLIDRKLLMLNHLNNNNAAAVHQLGNGSIMDRTCSTTQQLIMQNGGSADTYSNGYLGSRGYGTSAPSRSSAAQQLKQHMEALAATRMSLMSPQPEEKTGSGNGSGGYTPVEEWEALADVLERLFLVIFLAALAALSLGTFGSAMFLQ